MIFPDLTTITSGQHISYVAVFLAIILSGHIVPIPEDAVIFLAGYLGALRHSPFSFTILLMICILGPFCADALLFLVAKKGGRYTKWFLPHIKVSVLDRISKELHENTIRTVFFGRFIPGFRLASPLVSGTIGVKARSFLTASFFASLFYGPILFFLGYFFHSYLPHFFNVYHVAKHIVFGIMPFAVIVIIGFYFYQQVTEEDSEKV